MNKVLCLGELLLRISPSPNKAAADKHPMLLFVGGAEANVATALAGWDVPVNYCTVLPDNFMSQYVIQYLERKKINTSPILFSGNRIGLYYLETGADIKGGVVYDRDRSSFSELKKGMINWDAVFDGISWFHFTAISPALNHGKYLEQYISSEFTCAGVVDRSGSGDCFMAGLIYGFLSNPSQPQELLNYATAAAFGKLQEHGDATAQDVLTVEQGSGNDCVNKCDKRPGFF